MKIGIFGVAYTPSHSGELASLIADFKTHGMEVFIDVDYANTIPKSILGDRKVFSSKDEIRELDVFISIGGDGTILRAVSKVQDTGIPIMGINVGRLGFLATVKRENLFTLAETLIRKDYTLKPRSLLYVKNPSFDFPFALNEVTVTRKNTASMITIETFLDGEPLTSYWADGLIISTPTGSTGYSLSCGGPVMLPQTRGFAITPIAPHNLNARPLVVSDTTKISFRVTGRESRHLISLDTRTYSLKNNTDTDIEKASFMVNFVALKGESFLETLRHKLLWAEDRRN